MSHYPNIDRAAFFDGYVGYSNGTWRITKQSTAWWATRANTVEGKENFFSCRTLREVSERLTALTIADIKDYKENHTWRAK
jgi:hypothetical protein